MYVGCNGYKHGYKAVEVCSVTTIILFNLLASRIYRTSATMTSTTFNIDTTIQDVMSRFGDKAKDKTCKTDMRPYLKAILITYTDVITGASIKSLGAGAALGLATATPKGLILVGRSKSRIQPVIDDITASNPNVNAIFVEIDLLDLASVRKGAETIKSLTNEIHGMINSAGIMAVPEYQQSKDDIESQFATNHVAHFLLTNLLKDELINGHGVVVNVSSGGYELADINYDDVNFDQGKNYNSWVAYAQGKTANLLFSVAIAEKGSKHGVTAFAVNPGRKSYSQFILRHLVANS